MSLLLLQEELRHLDRKTSHPADTSSSLLASADVAGCLRLPPPSHSLSLSVSHSGWVRKERKGGNQSTYTVALSSSFRAPSPTAETSTQTGVFLSDIPICCVTFRTLTGISSSSQEYECITKEISNKKKHN